jgi:hypothetical protein
MMLVSLKMMPSSPPTAASCCSKVDDIDFLEHKVSRMYSITIKFGVEVVSLSPALVCMVASDGELFC